VPFSKWFGEVQYEGVIGGDTLTLSTASAFVRARLIEHYQQAIVACWKRMHSSSIERVEIAVRS
jgi:DnaA-like protein